MIAIIIGLLVTLVLFVVVISAYQQHREKQEADKRVKISKQKAIIDESQELIINLSLIPSSPNLTKILNKRSLNAAKAIFALSPETKSIKDQVDDFNMTRSFLIHCKTIKTCWSLSGNTKLSSLPCVAANFSDASNWDLKSST